MAAPALRLDTRNTHLDSVLEQVCVAIQLTQTQFEDAKQKYEAVGTWLSAPGSPLERFAPEIYPQGSMRLGTTIRPWKGEEFDLDLVCQLHGCGHAHPLAVYQAVHNRLKAHGVYASILQKKKRCLRLNYAGNFHLDILPACPDEEGGGTAIKVPDCQLADWKPSNPIGYAALFFERCQYQPATVLRLIEKRVRPLPSNVPSAMKYPLQRVVQLMKRHRDSFFDGNPDAARSILLTTLAGALYIGQESLTESLDAIVNGILAAIARTPGILRVPNPTNPHENFAEGWNQNTYPQFIRYMRSFRQHLDRLMQGEGMDEITKSLGGLVGRTMAEKAIGAHAKELERLRASRLLRVQPGSGQLATTAGMLIPRNNFYGAD